MPTFALLPVDTLKLFHFLLLEYLLIKNYLLKGKKYYLNPVQDEREWAGVGQKGPLPVFPL